MTCWLHGPLLAPCVLAESEVPRGVPRLWSVPDNECTTIDNAVSLERFAQRHVQRLGKQPAIWENRDNDYDHMNSTRAAQPDAIIATWTKHESAAQSTAMGFETVACDGARFATNAGNNPLLGSD